MSVITEHKVIDVWQNLNLVFTYKNKSEVIENFLCQIFAELGLEFSEFSFPAHKLIKQRCVRIIDKLKANNRNKKPNYYGFFDPEKTFFCESEFPDLLKKDVSKR